MNPLDEQVEAVASMIRAAGGITDINRNAPDFVKRAFLQMIAECPDCRMAMMGPYDGKSN